MEIDRQVALQLQEMEIARLHEKEPNSQRPDNRFAMKRNSAQIRTEYGPTYPKEYGPAVPTYGQPGESASVESPSQHRRRQHLPYHQQTLVSRKTKKGQQIQRHTQRQTQHDWDTHTPANAVQDQRIKQHQWDPHTPAYVPQRYDSGQRRGYNYFDQCKPPRQNQQNNYDYHNQWQFGKHWTSTPRDPNSKYNSSNVPGVSGDTTMNNSLLNILDTQCKVQQETTQALSSIIWLQDTRANDALLTDLPTFNGNPEEFLDWILKIEKVAGVNLSRIRCSECDTIILYRRVTYLVRRIHRVPQ